MTLAGRLERLVPALSVRERFLVALREFKADQKISARITDLTPTQLNEYQDYARLVVALNTSLGHYADVYAAHAGFLSDHASVHLDMLEQAATVLEAEHGIPREEVSWRTLRSKKDITVPHYLRGLAFQLRAKLLLEADELWQGIRAIEIVWSEAEAELGENPIHPSVREQGRSAEELVVALRSRLGGRKRAPEPGVELIESARQVVRVAARLQELQNDR